MAYYLLVRYNTNGGYVENDSGKTYYTYSAGLTSYSSPTSSSSTYKYFKAAQGSTLVTGCTTASGTYGTFGNRYTASSTSTVVNLTDVGTLNIKYPGYHTVANTAYRTTATGGNVIGQNGSSAPSANRATISRLGGSTSANKTVNIFVNWIANTYTINYSANGGSFSDTAPTTSATYGSNVTFSSTIPTRAGYTFLGWSSSSTATSATWTAGQTTTTAPNLTTIDGGTATVYAIWQANTYYILLDENQATTNTIGLTVKNVQYGSTTNNTVSVPTRYGHTFNGYYTALTDGTQVYNSSGNAVAGTYWSSSTTTVFYVADEGPYDPNSMGTDGTYLYLYDSPNYYRITVDGSDDWVNLGTTAPSGVSNWVNEGAQNLVNYQGNNYYWTHYYYESSGRDVVNVRRADGGGWQYAGNLVLYAHWTSKNYSYILNPNGGTYNGATTAVTKTVTYGTNLNSNPGVPIRTGYRFDGWYTSGGMRVFDSAGFPISNYSNGGYWMQSYPQHSYRSSGKYLRYGDFVWGYVNTTNGGDFAFWDGDIGEWHQVYLGQKAQSNDDFHAIGNVVCSRELVSGGNIITYAGVNCNLADSTITYPYTTTLYNNIGSFSVERLYGSTWYGDAGIDYIWIGSTSPTLYAHWTPTVYLKQNGSWSGCTPQIKVNDEWKTPNAIYVKSNDTWQLTWSPSLYTIDTILRTNIFTFKQEGGVRIIYDLIISGTANTDGTYSGYKLALSLGSTNTQLKNFDINVSNGVFTVTASGSTYTTLDGTKTNKMYIYGSSGIAPEITGWHITGTIKII